MKHVNYGLFLKKTHNNVNIEYSTDFFKQSGTFSTFVLKVRRLINTGGWVGNLETGNIGRGGDFFLSCPSSVGIGFSAIEPISKSLKIEGEKEYSCQVGGLHPCSSHVPSTKIRYPADRIPDSRLYPCLVRVQLEALHPAPPLSLLGCVWLELAPDGC